MICFNYLTCKHHITIFLSFEPDATILAAPCTTSRQEISRRCAFSTWYPWWRYSEGWFALTECFCGLCTIRLEKIGSLSTTCSSVPVAKINLSPTGRISLITRSRPKSYNETLSRNLHGFWSQLCFEFFLTDL